MKKLLLVLLVTLMMTGCATMIMVGCDNNGKPLGYTYLELDSCEYIAGYNQLAHKGNCHFCKERDSIKWEKRKRELEELIIKLKEE